MHPATESFDPRVPEHRADPFPVFRRLQDEAPVHYSPLLKGWVLTRYADVKTALTDKAFSADRITPLEEHLPEALRRATPHLFTMVKSWPVFKDPPAHTRLRGLINHALTQRAIEQRIAVIQATIDALLRGVLPNGRMDVIADFAYPLPAMVIMTLLGAPHADLDLLKTWSDDLALFVGSAAATGERHQRSEAAAQALLSYFAPFIRERRDHPRDDVMSAFLSGHGSALSDDEIAAMSVLLMFAGHETTTNLIGNGLLTLLRHPDALALLTERPDLLEPAIEEMVRYDGPLAAMTRIVREPLALGGAELRPGDRVFAFLNAANRDGRRFADPDRFDLERQDNAHLTFGHGIHYCPGAPLARLEGRLAFATLLRRLGRIELGEGALAWHPSLVFRGVKALPITFRGGEG